SAMLHEAKSRPAFLNGEYRAHGWWQFFPYCVLVKTPLTLFVLLLLAAAWNIHYWRSAGSERTRRFEAMRRSLYGASPLLSRFVVHWLFSISSHLNIGNRLILRTYPPMLIFAGGAWMWVAERRKAATGNQHLSARERADASRTTAWFRSRRHPI